MKIKKYPFEKNSYIIEFSVHNADEFNQEKIQLKSWLDICELPYVYMASIISFKTNEDAMHFELTWGLDIH